MGGHQAAAQAQQQAQPVQQQATQQPVKKSALGGFFGSNPGTGQAYLGGASDSQRNTFLGL